MNNQQQQQPQQQQQQQQQQRVTFGNTNVRQIPNNEQIIGSRLQQHPQTGQIFQVPVTEGNMRTLYNQHPYEKWQAAQGAQQEASLTSRERGYKRMDEVRPLNKPKQYDPVTGKWNGGKKTKKRSGRKSRKTKTKSKRTTRRR
jgi:hypothetical protein